MTATELEPTSLRRLFLFESLDDEQVAWAVATRTQPDRDLLVVPNAKGSSLDPSAEQGLTAKLGLDATVPAADRDRYRQMTVAPADPSALERHLAELGDLR